MYTLVDRVVLRTLECLRRCVKSMPCRTHVSATTPNLFTATTNTFTNNTSKKNTNHLYDTTQRAQRGRRAATKTNQKNGDELRGNGGEKLVGQFKHESCATSCCKAGDRAATSGVVYVERCVINDIVVVVVVIVVVVVVIVTACQRLS
jgi:hypothetical protein